MNNPAPVVRELKVILVGESGVGKTAIATRSELMVARLS
jgi:GTPase SAR1 family protein